MTLQWIPLEALQDHPENSNRMPPHLVEKLKGHIARTGRYEPLVVRPIREAKGDRSLALAASRPPAPSRDTSRDTSRDREVAGTREGQEAPGAREASAGERTPDLTVGARHAPHAERGPCSPRPMRYQILNGHHRARVLRDLGHTRARCDVWEVDDEEARLLLATLNRLEGRDDPSARAALVGRLAEGRSAQDLARLLPEPPDAVERLRKLAEPPPPPADPASAAPLPRAMTFFLDDDQEALVREALRAANDSRGGSPHPPRAGRNERDGYGDQPRTARDPSREAKGDRSLTLAASGGEGAREARPSRADALVRLAQWYLEARGLR